MPVRLNGQGAPDLADVLRGAGLLVDESAVPDWRNRSRSGNSSWYADGRPTHVMVHHTASGAGSHDTMADERAEARYCGTVHEVKPVSNLYLGPSGTWYPLAAGPSNTNGVGIDTWGGGVAIDSMNSYAVAIEAGNNGVGEPWPQIDGYVRGCAALCKAYGIPARHVRAHHEWAPNRKIDPASGQTSTPYSPHERYGMFDMEQFRRDVARLLIPLPDLEDDDDMAKPMILLRGPSGQMYATDRERVAYRVGEDTGAYLRDERGFAVGPDTGPFPCSAAEEAYLIDMAG